MILFSCRRVAELTSKEMDARPRLAERVGAGGHRLLCGMCRLYRRQLIAVEAAIRESLGANADTGDERLPDATKARIHDTLKDAMT